MGNAITCKCAYFPWWIPSDTWTPDNMTLIEGFRDDALDGSNFAGWGRLMAGLVVFALAAETYWHFKAKSRGDDVDFESGWGVCTLVGIVVCFSGYVYGWLGVTELINIPGTSAEAYCMEFRSPTDYASPCPDTGLVQDYFVEWDEKKGKNARNDGSQWIGITSGIEALVVVLVLVLPLMIVVPLSSKAGGIGPLLALCGYIVLLFMALSRAMNTYVETWPKNGCYLALCTRHGTDNFGTPKTSMSPSDLRDRWQNGVNSVYDCIALTVAAMIYVVATVVLRTLLAWFDSNRRADNTAAARQLSLDAPSYAAADVPSVYPQSTDVLPVPPSPPPPPGGASPPPVYNPTAGPAAPPPPPPPPAYEPVSYRSSAV